MHDSAPMCYACDGLDISTTDLTVNEGKNMPLLNAATFTFREKIGNSEMNQRFLENCTHNYFGLFITPKNQNK